MTKTLKDFLEVYKPKSPDEQKFVDKHVVIKHKDRNGNGDDVFNGNTKTIKRKEERHGYDAGEDEKVYEALKGDQHKIDANKNGKVDAHDFKLLRKKKVAEEAEDVEEARIYTDDYEVTSEKSQFGGHRPKVVHKEKGHTMFLGQHAYKKPATAVKHGEAYLSAYATRGDNAAQNASFDFARANKKHLYVKEDIDAVLDEALELLMSIDEKTLTPAEMKKREEVVKAIKRDDPKMDKSMAYAIATKTAKRVAEGTMPTADEPTDANKKMAQKVRDLLAKEKKPVKEEAEELDEMSSYEVTGEHTDGHLKTLSYFAKSPAHAKSQFHAKQSKKDYTVKSVKKLAESAELDESAKIAAHLIKRYGDNVRKSHVVSAANDFGVDASKLAKAVRTKLGKNMLDEEDDGWYTHSQMYGSKKSEKHPKGISAAEWKSGIRWHHGKNKRINIKEDVEAIDELSKGTMLKYLSANKKSDKAAQEKGDFSKSDKRMRGTDVAVRKYTATNNKYVRVPATEEVEQVDELSSKKLTDYMDKASDARGHRNLSTKKVDNRYAGVKKASDKLTKEEVEVIDELSKKTLGSYVKKASGAEQPKNVMSPKNVPLTKIASYQGDSETGYFGKRFNQHTYDKAERLRKNRETGIKTAVDKLTKEEVEAIDELSKKTLGSYVNKAAFKIGDQGITAGLKIQNNEPAGKNLKKMGNRQKGVERAVKKLTKEDVINRAVEKYVPEELKFTPEERLLKRINGLSEAHVNTILGLFEALNKDNQNKMIETAETREGINQILNFVLENRG